MIEEPYRWVEAIANRREYIEHQLAAGSPIVALTYSGGILVFTLGRSQLKLFEVYDRIAMGGIGHPGDIERLRMAAIEVASAEGFTRSADDVSLRRLATYSMSPALKAAFEQIYGPPYLARLLFAELGRNDQSNLFVRLEYDGTIHTSGTGRTPGLETFGVVSGTAGSQEAMERFLSSRDTKSAPLEKALKIALDAWTVGHLAQTDEDVKAAPDEARIAATRRAEMQTRTVEAAVLEREAHVPATFRKVDEREWKSLEVE